MRRPARSSERWRGFSSAQLIVFSFLGAILLGAALLRLPVSQASGQSVTWLDALFTATSAVCVTGLAVVDTGSAYSRFGQVVILLLFQAGGLGILTLGALLALATRRRVGFGARLQLQAQLNALQVGGVLRLVRRIVLLVLVCELLGALLLYPSFARLEGAREGAFFALFHSVSAFNNAGFALYPDSLVRFVGDPFVSLGGAALILAGGLGFAVAFDLLALRGPGRRQLSLHSKLALFSSFVLLASGTVALWALEWANPATLGELPLPGKLLAGFFQAVTPRTAGFNTLDYSRMAEPTLLVTMLLMFIGANPGSTGGGVKTVTFAVLLGSIWAVVRGRSEPALFGRRLELGTVMRAGVITVSALLTVGAGFLLLVMSNGALGFLELLFESISAFATVGLSLGITSGLNAFGKGVIILLMFMGRVGLLTFALALVAARPERALRYPSEEVMIG